MVYEVTSAEMAPGKGDEARAWAKEIQEHISKTYGAKGHAVGQITPEAERGNRLAWINAFDSLQSWGAFHDKTPQDAKWQALGKNFGQVFVANTFTRTVYRSLA